MRKTKIVCTLGPGTDDASLLESLMKEGMNVARLNFSHGNQEEHKRRVDMVKGLREKLRMPVALILDTRGPEIRIRQFEGGSVDLSAGDAFTLTTEEITGNKNAVSVTHKGFPGDLRRGDSILIDDGLIELKVTKTTKNEINCEVVTGGTLSNNKSINVPGVHNSLPYLNDRDRADLVFGIREGFDFIAASFVRNTSDVRDLRDFMADNGSDSLKIISKIENRDGVDNIDEIIRVSDGIMVARGDMGVEIPFEELPSIQKEIIRKCYIAGKPVITATQMLDSMIRNPRPTRAEITDVANAIYDGTSAIMLSGETSIGKYPVEAVKTMSRIAVETEKKIDYAGRFNDLNIPKSRNVTNAISHATCEAAHTLGAAAIISVTKSGHTAKMVSKYRPACPIIATTVTPGVYQQLSLTWGVFPLLTEKKDSTDDIFAQAVDCSVESGLIREGDLIVITGGMLVNVSGTTNTLQVFMVGNVLLEGKGANERTACGVVCVVRNSEESTPYFNDRDILVIDRSTDEILKAIKHASALITEERAGESEAAIVGRAMDIPVITDAFNATSILKSGIVVTVNAKEGRIYSGCKK